MPTSTRRRPRRLLLWFASLCLLLVLGVAAYFYLTGPHLRPDPRLLPELEQSSLVAETPDRAVADWPQWRGPRRDGVSGETGLLTEWPADGPRVVWRKPIGGGYSAVAVADGRAFTLMRQDDEEVVVCWDADTGDEQWRFAYPCSYSNSYGSGPRSTPTIDDGRVYAVGAAGMFHCLDAATGQELWKHDLLTEFRAPNLRWGVSFSPLIEGELVYTNPGGPGDNALAAFHKVTGELVWKARGGPAGYSSPIAVTAAGVRQVLFFTGDSLVSVDPATGALYWRVPWPTSHGVNAATPIFFQARDGDQVRDYVFISSGYGKGCALLKIEPGLTGPTAGLVYENNKMANHFSTSVRLGEHFYGFSDPGVLTCMDVRTGQEKWSQRGFQKGSLLTADGKLILLGEQGLLALADADPEQYRERARFQLFNTKCWTMPALARGRLYVRDEAEIVCLDLRR